MRQNRDFGGFGRLEVRLVASVPMPLQAFAFGPMGSFACGPWAEIYRLAYERTVEALRPTRYDRAMLAPAN